MKSAYVMVLSLMLFVGCSSSGGEAPSTFSTSVDGSKPVKDLTSAEITQLCQEFVAFSTASTYQADSCALAGLIAAGTLAEFNAEATDAEIQTACTESVTQCQGNDTAADCMDTNDVPETCEVTVQQTVTCLNDTVAGLRGVAAMIPACGSLTRASMEPSGGGIDIDAVLNPASCAPVRAETCQTPDQT